jgi:hypothetical protein
MFGLTTSRLVAATAGVLAASGALAILLSNALTTGHFSLEDYLCPIVVVLALCGAHLAPRALLELKIISAAGWFLIMLAGTLATLYLSVGRQASLSDNTVLQAEDSNLQRSVELESLGRNRSMLKEEQDRYDKECPVEQRSTKNCKRLETTLDVYAKAVKGDLYELRGIGPAQAIQSRAARVADALNVLFSCDRDHALKILTTFEPFLFSVLLELGSLIAFSYAFSRQRPSKAVPSAAKQDTDQVWHTHNITLESDAKIRTVINPPVDNKVDNKVINNIKGGSAFEEAKSALLNHLTHNHGTSASLGTSNIAMARALGVDKGTLRLAAAALQADNIIRIDARRNVGTTYTLVADNVVPLRQAQRRRL